MHNVLLSSIETISETYIAKFIKEAFVKST